MRNSAFSTITTKSRGVKSSLTRITLCSGGRATFGTTLVRGLVSRSGMLVSHLLRDIILAFYAADCTRDGGASGSG